MEIRAIQSGAKTFRGNLHTHTTVSDGRRSPEEAAIWYRDNGYDFVAITDHWKTLEPLSVDGILVIPGVEYHANDPELGAFHMVGIDIQVCPEREATIAATEMASYITGHGGLAVLCHPYWCGMSSWAVERVEGVFAVEVFNTTCEVAIAKGVSSVHWDDALDHGRRLWGLAVDDAHWGRKDYGGGWVQVQAEELSIPALREALLAGRFYASTGPEILDLVYDGTRVYARTSDARRIAFVGDAWRGSCTYAEGDGTINEAEFTRLDGIKYVRLEVDDGQGRRAWSNPIYIGG
ncbi:MAG: CehA/McbA family metallohydrolase [Anaerolineae bacterium]|jgi:hypothetical protein